MSKIHPCIWCDHTAQEQADFYVSLLPNARILRVQDSPVDTPSQSEGDPLFVEIELGGLTYLLLNGGDQFPQTEAVSFMILTDDQAETDRLWDAIVGNCGQESQCGWCKDKWGVNWQITPRRLMELGYDIPDKAASRRVLEAMFTMKKIDIARLEAAAAGEG